MLNIAVYEPEERYDATSPDYDGCGKNWLPSCLRNSSCLWRLNYMRPSTFPGSMIFCSRSCLRASSAERKGSVWLTRLWRYIWKTAGINGFWSTWKFRAMDWMILSEGCFNIFIASMTNMNDKYAPLLWSHRRRKIRRMHSATPFSERSCSINTMSFYVPTGSGSPGTFQQSFCHGHAGRDLCQ